MEVRKEEGKLDRTTLFRYVKDMHKDYTQENFTDMDIHYFIIALPPLWNGRKN